MRGTQTHIVWSLVSPSPWERWSWVGTQCYCWTVPDHCSTPWEAHTAFSEGKKNTVMQHLHCVNCLFYTPSGYAQTCVMKRYCVQHARQTRCEEGNWSKQHMHCFIADLHKHSFLFILSRIRLENQTDGPKCIQTIDPRGNMHIRVDASLILYSNEDSHTEWVMNATNSTHSATQHHTRQGSKHWQPSLRASVHSVTWAQWTHVLQTQNC